MGKKPGLFIIGATNRPDLLDSALLRTGRFDKMIYLGVASTVEEKVKIITACTRTMKLDPSVDLNKVAERLPRNFTGADFGALASETYMHAVHKRIELLEKEIEAYKKDNGFAESDELLPETYFKLKYGAEGVATHGQIIVELDDFYQGVGRVVPSISIDELARYEGLRDKYSGSKS